ncbi:hypothetical protein D3C81_1355370 [compost metagenome]
MRDAHVGRQRGRIHGETVILRRNHHTTIIHVLDRMVRAMVAELHLEGLGAHGQRHDLVTQADAEGGDTACDELARGGHGVVARLGVAGAVGQEDAVRIQRQGVGGAGLGRQHRDLAAALGQHAQDVELDAVVIGDHVELRLVLLAVAFAQRPFGLGPLVRLLDRNHLGQVHAGQAGERAGQVDGLLHVVLASQDAAVLGALLAQDAGQLAGIDAGDRHHLFLLQVVREGVFLAEIGGQDRQILDDQAGGMDFRGFDILRIDTVVADMRIRQRDDLPRIARVGEDFLVTGDGGVEHHFTDGMAGSANGIATKDRAVC